MKKLLPEITCAIGSAVFVAGLASFLYGSYTTKRLWLEFWGYQTLPAHVALCGAALAVVGAGITVFGFLWMRSRR